MSGQHWVVDLMRDLGLRSDEVPPPPKAAANGHASDAEQAASYITKMLERNCAELATTKEGERNHILNTKAYRVGRFVGGGYLDRATAEAALFQAASTSGLGSREVWTTMRNGLRDGERNPATVPQGADNVDFDAPFQAVPDSLGTDGNGEGTDEDEGGTWLPVDLGPYLDGTYVPPETGLLVRDDSVGLLYPGHVHWFHGESESGKSWIAQATSARALDAGKRVLYVDHESNPGELVYRLLLMGVATEAIRAGFDYLHPEVPVAAEWENYRRLLAGEYGLVVVDGVTDAIGLDKAESNDNDQIARWMRRVPKLLARYTGAAAICIDHVSKDADSRGRFAIGGQHKMAGIDGAAYVVDVAEPIGRGMRGTLVMRVAKDRPGEIRPHCGAYRKSDRTQEAARVVLDSTSTDRTIIEIGKPSMHDKDDTELLRIAISRYLEEEAPARMANKTTIRREITGKNERINLALERMVADGNLTFAAGVYTLIDPFRSDESNVNLDLD